MRESWTGAAFGLALSGDFKAPGLEGGTAATTGGRTTALRRVTRAELDRAWSPARATTLVEQNLAGTRFAVAQADAGSYMLRNDYYGLYMVASGGAEVLCAPSELPDWLWQRFLVGQVLPLAALLQGLEPLHSSAVAIEDRGLLLMGPSGAGKSSVALHLTAGGATFMADDVSALELRSGRVVVHPGARLASVSPSELQRLPDPGDDGLQALGVCDGETRVVLGGRSTPPPARVHGVYLLTRDDDAKRLEIERGGIDWPATLLGGTFNSYEQDPARLLGQLDICGALVEEALLRRVRVPRGADASAVARAIDHSFRRAVREPPASSRR